MEDNSNNNNNDNSGQRLTELLLPPPSPPSPNQNGSVIPEDTNANPSAPVTFAVSSTPESPTVGVFMLGRIAVNRHWRKKRGSRSLTPSLSSEEEEEEETELIERKTETQLRGPRHDS